MKTHIQMYAIPISEVNNALAAFGEMLDLWEWVYSVLYRRCETKEAESSDILPSSGECGYNTLEQIKEKELFTGNLKLQQSEVCDGSKSETKELECSEILPSSKECIYKLEKIKENELSTENLALQKPEVCDNSKSEAKVVENSDIPPSSRECVYTLEHIKDSELSTENLQQPKVCDDSKSETKMVEICEILPSTKECVYKVEQINEKELFTENLELQQPCVDFKSGTKVVENCEILPSTRECAYELEQIKEKEYYTETPELQSDGQQSDFLGENLCVGDSQILLSDSESPCENSELDTEISYCSFVTTTTIENPSVRKEARSEEPTLLVPEVCDNSESEPGKVNGHELIAPSEQATEVKAEELPVSIAAPGKNEVEDDLSDLGRTQKFTAASCDLVVIVESLYRIKENSRYQTFLPSDASEEKFEETLTILSKGAFCEHPEDNYLVIIEDSILYITKDSQVICSLNVKYAQITIEAENILKLDNRMGRCLFIKCDSEDLRILKDKLELHCLNHWQTDCLQLVHYPLKCHQNVVIIDLGSCSTRAGILMDQPTLPSIFFPTVCATDKTSGNSVYGMEALQSEVRHRSNLSFPIRPTNKITKHTVDTKMLEGLFKKIFCDLKIDPTEYTVQVCLPRNLSINTQTALVKLLLEDLKVKAVSMTNQALLTLYAHDVSTAVVVDIGDRTDVLPVVDGFIVENGVTQLPHGGQRLIHHMKHSLAEKRMSLSNDIDSFVVQYIIESLAYVADDYENEMQITLQYPDIVRKTVTLQPAASENQISKNITLEEARFNVPEGLFNPDLWGLDSPGIHHLVQKAIQATGVDARRQVAENIYVSGGVTMLPGFVERLSKEVAKLSKTKIVPKVYASNYRYHCTYIGACKFAKMDVFSQVCISLEEYSKNSASALRKCALYF